MTKVVLLGGPFDRREIDIRREPPRLEVAGRIYERINDPETGASLGAYVIADRTDGTEER
jgi:hypothetical protein